MPHHALQIFLCSPVDPILPQGLFSPLLRFPAKVLHVPCPRQALLGRQPGRLNFAAAAFAFRWGNNSSNSLLAAGVAVLIAVAARAKIVDLVAELCAEGAFATGTHRNAEHQAVFGDRATSERNSHLLGVLDVDFGIEVDGFRTDVSDEVFRQAVFPHHGLVVVVGRPGGVTATAPLTAALAFSVLIAAAAVAIVNPLPLQRRPLHLLLLMLLQDVVTFGTGGPDIFERRPLPVLLFVLQEYFEAFEVEHGGCRFHRCF